MKKTKIILTTVLVYSCFLSGQNTHRKNNTAQDSIKTPLEIALESIEINDIKKQMKFLAGKTTKGRAVGTKGAYTASYYIKRRLKKYGLKGFANLDTATKQDVFFQTFNLIRYRKKTAQQMSLTVQKNNFTQTFHLQDSVDFTTTTNSMEQEFDAPLVFVGYGMQNISLAYNDFYGVDVKGKIMVRYKGYPGHRDTLSLAYKAFRHMNLKNLEKEKNILAKKLGAVGVITIDPAKKQSNWVENLKGFSPPKKRNAPYYNYKYELSQNSKIQTLYIKLSPRVEKIILENADLNVGIFEKEVANNLNIYRRTDFFKGVRLKIRTKIDVGILRARNVVGVLEGTIKDEYILVGAHHDHLGKSGDKIWYGADDNASGVVGVLQMAKAFMTSGIKPKRSIIFATWTGEECGLRGSEYFASQMENEKIKIAVNYDMIGRNADWDKKGNKCSLIYTKSLPYIAQMTKVNNLKTKLDINYAPMEKPFGASDQSSFAKKGVPVAWFFIGSHKDYHQISDTAEKINWEKMQRIIKLGFLNLWRFANEEKIATP